LLATSLAAREPEAGVKVGNPSFVRKLVSAEKVEQQGEMQYLQLTGQVRQKGALLSDNHPQVVRLRRIFQDLLPHSYKFNERAKDWKWEVNVFNARQINAFCMPGGKIAFFTGILQQLQLSDDEVAVVMGHEIAHALREHARERMAKGMLTNVGAIAVSILVGGNAGELARVGGGLLSLKFSRSDETEADLVGMEIAARAGYDPAAGITLWEKMSAAAKGAPPQWLSTHPASTTRIDTIRKNLKDVLPLYEEARARRRG
jgi:predicted Zn-dependent protease